MLRGAMLGEEEPKDKPAQGTRKRKRISSGVAASVRSDYRKYNKLLRELEDDSVDTDILDDELRSLQATEPQTCRGRTVEFLNSSPVHLVICVLIMFDAAIVIAEILLDLHAMRSQYVEVSTDKDQLVQFLTEQNGITNFTNEDVDRILRQLKMARGLTNGTNPYGNHSRLSGHPTEFKYDELLFFLLKSVSTDIENISNLTENSLKLNDTNLNVLPSLATNRHSLLSGPITSRRATTIKTPAQPSQKSSNLFKPIREETDENRTDNSDKNVDFYSFLFSFPSIRLFLLQPEVKILWQCKENKTVSHSGKTPKSDYQTLNQSDASVSPANYSSMQVDFHAWQLRNYNYNLDSLSVLCLPSTDNVTTLDLISKALNIVHNRLVLPMKLSNTVNATFSQTQADINDLTFNRSNVMLSDFEEGDDIGNNITDPVAGIIHLHEKGFDNHAGSHHDADERDHHSHEKLSYAKMLHTAAHILHYISIVILGLFVLQVFVKVYAMGSDFFRNKMELFDGVITLTSFALDLAFMEGVTVVQGQEAIALLVVFLLWRILRLVNGLLVAAKQRQEFRIKLQKRGRMRSEKKVAILEMELNRREREIENLVRLCTEKGISRDEISACRPKQSHRQLNASTGLSSVASFSLGLSMSMRGSGGSPSEDMGHPYCGSFNPSPNAHRPSHVGLLPPASSASSLHSAPYFSAIAPPAINCPRRVSIAPGTRKQSFQELFPVHAVSTGSSGRISRLSGTLQKFRRKSADDDHFTAISKSGGLSPRTLRNKAAAAAAASAAATAIATTGSGLPRDMADNFGSHSSSTSVIIERDDENLGHPDLEKGYLTHLRAFEGYMPGQSMMTTLEYEDEASLPMIIESPTEDMISSGLEPSASSRRLLSFSESNPTWRRPEFGSKLGKTANSENRKRHSMPSMSTIGWFSIASRKIAKKQQGSQTNLARDIGTEENAIKLLDNPYIHQDCYSEIVGGTCHELVCSSGRHKYLCEVADAQNVNPEDQNNPVIFTIPSTSSIIKPESGLKKKTSKKKSSEKPKRDRKCSEVKFEVGNSETEQDFSENALNGENLCVQFDPKKSDAPKAIKQRTLSDSSRTKRTSKMPVHKSVSLETGKHTPKSKYSKNSDPRKLKKTVSQASRDHIDRSNNNSEFKKELAGLNRIFKKDSNSNETGRKKKRNPPLEQAMTFDSMCSVQSDTTPLDDYTSEQFNLDVRVDETKLDKLQHGENDAHEKVLLSTKNAKDKNLFRSNDTNANELPEVRIVNKNLDSKQLENIDSLIKAKPKVNIRTLPNSDAEKLSDTVSEKGNTKNSKHTSKNLYRRGDSESIAVYKPKSQNDIHPAHLSETETYSLPLNNSNLNSVGKPGTNIDSYDALEIENCSQPNNVNSTELAVGNCVAVQGNLTKTSDNHKNLSKESLIDNNIMTSPVPSRESRPGRFTPSEVAKRARRNWEKIKQRVVK